MADIHIALSKMPSDQRACVVRNAERLQEIMNELQAYQLLAAIGVVLRA